MRIGLFLAIWLAVSVIFALGSFVGFRLGAQSQPRPWRDFLHVPDDA